MKTVLGTAEMEFQNDILSCTLDSWAWRIQEQGQRLTESEKEWVKAAEAVDSTVCPHRSRNVNMQLIP